jgi:hypothetical protein
MSLNLKGSMIAEEKTEKDKVAPSFQVCWYMPIIPAHGRLREGLQVQNKKHTHKKKMFHHRKYLAPSKMYYQFK